MKDMANAYKISVGKPSAKSPTRIIRLREYDIEMDLTEIGVKGVGWLNLDQDKVAAVVKTVMNLVIP
jgi:hypothetical protein